MASPESLDLAGPKHGFGSLAFLMSYMVNINTLSASDVLPIIDTTQTQFTINNTKYTDFYCGIITNQTDYWKFISNDYNMIYGNGFTENYFDTVNNFTQNSYYVTYCIQENIIAQYTRTNLVISEHLTGVVRELSTNQTFLNQVTDSYGQYFLDNAWFGSYQLIFMPVHTGKFFFNTYQDILEISNIVANNILSNQEWFSNIPDEFRNFYAEPGYITAGLDTPVIVKWNTQTDINTAIQQINTNPNATFNAQTFIENLQQQRSDWTDITANFVASYCPSQSACSNYLISSLDPMPSFPFYVSMELDGQELAFYFWNLTYGMWGQFSQDNLPTPNFCYRNMPNDDQHGFTLPCKSGYIVEFNNIDTGVVISLIFSINSILSPDPYTSSVGIIAAPYVAS